MTEKRFTETVSTGIVTDHVTGKEYDCEMRISDDLLSLLNKLHEENKELRLLVDTLKEQNMKFKLRLKDLGVEYL